MIGRARMVISLAKSNYELVRVSYFRLMYEIKSIKVLNKSKKVKSYSILIEIAS